MIRGPSVDSHSQTLFDAGGGSRYRSALRIFEIHVVLTGFCHLRLFGDVLHVEQRSPFFDIHTIVLCESPFWVARCGLPPQITGDRQWLRLW